MKSNWNQFISSTSFFSACIFSNFFHHSSSYHVALLSSFQALQQTKKFQILSTPRSIHESKNAEWGCANWRRVLCHFINLHLQCNIVFLDLIHLDFLLCTFLLILRSISTFLFCLCFAFFSFSVLTEELRSESFDQKFFVLSTSLAS